MVIFRNYEALYYHKSSANAVGVFRVSATARDGCDLIVEFVAVLAVDHRDQGLEGHCLASYLFRKTKANTLQFKDFIGETPLFSYKRD